VESGVEVRRVSRRRLSMGEVPCPAVEGRLEM